MRQFARLALVVPIGAAAFAGGIRIVEPTGTHNYSSIGSAIAAASEGDVILVGAGTYSGFTLTNKSVSIFALPGADVRLTTPISIVGLQPSKTVVIRGIDVEVAYVQGAESPALGITGCQGNVRIEDGTFRAIDYPLCACPFPEVGVPGARVLTSARVAFQGCTFLGGRGQGLVPGAPTTGGAIGGPGVTVLDSTIALYDCTSIGGEGGRSDGTPGVGGTGIEIRPSFDTSRLIASNALASGGLGGANSLPSPGAPGGTGGIAVTFGSGCCLGTLYEVACTLVPGTGGAGAGGTGATGATYSGSAPIVLAGPARRCAVTPAVQADLAAWSVVYAGAAGEQPVLFAARDPAFSISPDVHGAWLARRTALLGLRMLGTTDGAGVLSVNLATGDLPAGSLLQKRFAQAATDSTGPVWLGSQASLILLDRDSGPDCNGNGVSDFVDVLIGTVADANHSLIPDSCPGG